MSNELNRAKAILKTGGSLDEMEMDALASELNAMPEHDKRFAVEQIAVDLRERSVPLLEALALTSGESLAAASTRALASIKDQAASTALQRVSLDASSNRVKKAARRGLHALATLGVHPAKEAAYVQKKSKAKIAQVEALGSPIDGFGDRGLWMAFGKGGDIEYLGLVLNEEKGIEEAFSTEMSRSRFDKEADKVRKDEKMPWVDIPVDYCRYLIDEAQRKNKITGNLIPRVYLAWRDRIGLPEKVYERPLVYEVINAAEVRWDPRYLDSSGDLIRLEMFQTWVMSLDELIPFLREIETINHSGLVLVGINQEARMKMVLDRAIQILFDARRRALYKRRLEEMSYLLWKIERPEMAKTALAAALALEPAERSLLEHPFIKALIEWNLSVVEAIVRGEQVREIKPGVRLHLPY